MVYWIPHDETVMDIVIAAAGKGTRLQGYSSEIPKHVIPIAGKPFIYYLLDAVVVAGYRRVFVVGGHFVDKLRTVVEAYDTDTELIVVDQHKELGDDRYGTACPLLAVENYLQGDRFVYTMGDHLLGPLDLQAMQQSTVDSLVAVTEHDMPERYGVIEYTTQRTLARIMEKPKRLNPVQGSQDINVGLYTLTRDIFKVLHYLQPSERGELEITDALNQLAKNHAVRLVRLQQPWMDLGRPEDIEALEHYLQP